MRGQGYEDAALVHRVLHESRPQVETLLQVTACGRTTRRSSDDEVVLGRVSPTAMAITASGRR